MHHPRLALATLPLALSLAFSAPACADDATDGTIVVTATRQPLRVNEALADVDVIDRDELANAGQSTLIEVLSRHPGIQVTSSGGPGASVSVFIRGANSTHTLVLVDGIRFGAATSGQPALESIPPSQIERIEILRGPASSLYGSDAIGGVIQIFTRKGSGRTEGEVFAGVGSHGTNELNGSLSLGSGPVRLGLHAGLLRTQGIDALGNPPDRDGFKQDSGSGNLTVALPGRGELGLSFAASHGSNDIDSGNTRNSRLDKASALYAAHWRQPVTGTWTSTLTAGENLDDQASYDTSFDGVITTKRRQFGWQNDIRLPNGTALLSIERTNEYVNLTNGTLDATERHIDSALAGWTGFFGDHRWQANIRRDTTSQYGGKTTGALAYGYQLTSVLRAHATVGTAFKAPSFNDLYFPVFVDPLFGTFGGNPNLKPEYARNREVGLNWDDARRQIALVAFDNRIEDLIVWGNQPFNVGKARLQGANLSYSTRAGAWTGSASLSALRARDADTDQRLIRRAARQLTTHVGRQAGAWTIGGEWLLLSNREDTADFVTGRREMLGGYGIVNAYAHYTVTPAWRIEVRGNNLGDKRYSPSFGTTAADRSLFVGVRYTTR